MCVCVCVCGEIQSNVRLNAILIDIAHRHTQTRRHAATPNRIESSRHLRDFHIVTRKWSGWPNCLLAFNINRPLIWRPLCVAMLEMRGFPHLVALFRLAFFSNVRGACTYIELWCARVHSDTCTMEHLFNNSIGLDMIERRTSNDAQTGHIISGDGVVTWPECVLFKLKLISHGTCYASGKWIFMLCSCRGPRQTYAGCDELHAENSVDHASRTRPENEFILFINNRSVMCVSAYSSVPAWNRIRWARSHICTANIIHISF